ncbi:hypothetical protein BJX62DRAFT_197540 [Aspergillus germanicus]
MDPFPPRHGVYTVLYPGLPHLPSLLWVFHSYFVDFLSLSLLLSLFLFFSPIQALLNTILFLSSSPIPKLQALTTPAYPELSFPSLSLSPQYVQNILKLLTNSPLRKTILDRRTETTALYAPVSPLKWKPRRIRQRKKI